MLKLAKYIKPYWKAALLGPLLMVLEVSMDLLQPKLMAQIVDQGVMAGNLDEIRRTGLMMLATSLIGLVGGVGCGIFSTIAAMRFGADLREAVFTKVQRFSFRNLEKIHTASLITRLTNDVSQVQLFVQMLLRMMVRSPFLAAGSLILAFMINWRLAMILVVVVPILFTVVAVITRMGFPMFAKVQKRLDRMNTVLQENLAGIRVVKAFVRSDYETKRFTDANDDYMAVALRANVMMATLSPVMFLLLNGTIVTVLWLGGNLFWDQTLPIGDLAAFINYVTQLLSSLLMVGMMLANISRATASSQRIVEVLETEPEMKNPGQVAAERIRKGQIEFEGVGFAYDGGERVLRNISFAVQPGETLAILGATGSGKSTLVSLIPRLYEAEEGRVLVDGIDVRDYSLEGLRSSIGMVLQEAVLFSGTIRENIAFGKADAAMEEVEAAAKAAQAHDFIMGLPQGYETVLGQRGVNLSGGQKQRISIARALLMKPAVLIFDDSTSAVDLGTESRIQKALRELMRETTSLIIAQRISSVMEADRILVLEDGTVAASGNHRELMANSSVYRDIYRSQLGEEEIVYAANEH
ncbi:ABC transporter ATP-binding protein [Paenibacillus sp. YN15]|uniref:ABC transporter ATP-binding protein n=1 Tax=Paenibacillus sp. YN15 TaxID=1742774 RepID=UPI000DCB4CDC|nr:ABC transporter ATP-binding protein [Paenibacillus sp. YN15]RAV01484.1 ABC transporter ATP-binding protein [Paenibacillus sp. YN15]